MSHCGVSPGDTTGLVSAFMDGICSQMWPQRRGSCMIRVQDRVWYRNGLLREEALALRTEDEQAIGRRGNYSRLGNSINCKCEGLEVYSLECNSFCNNQFCFWFTFIGLLPFRVRVVLLLRGGDCWCGPALGSWVSWGSSFSSTISFSYSTNI